MKAVYKMFININKYDGELKAQRDRLHKISINASCDESTRESIADFERLFAIYASKVVYADGIIKFDGKIDTFKFVSADGTVHTGIHGFSAYGNELLSKYTQNNTTGV